MKDIIINSLIMMILGAGIGIGLGYIKVYLEQEKEERTLEQYADEYEAIPILTPHEKANYSVMLPIAQKLGYEIFAKVRLADIIKPTSTGKARQKFFNKIKSKHCDFVICDSRLNIVAVVEIDDATHQRSDREKRYNFTDFVLNDCGIKVLHFTNATALEFESKLRAL